jgi:hypothetical protein
MSIQQLVRNIKGAFEEVEKCKQTDLKEIKEKYEEKHWAVTNQKEQEVNVQIKAASEKFELLLTEENYEKAYELLKRFRDEFTEVYHTFRVIVDIYHESKKEAKAQEQSLSNLKAAVNEFNLPQDRIKKIETILQGKNIDLHYTQQLLLESWSELTNIRGQKLKEREHASIAKKRLSYLESNYENMINNGVPEDSDYKLAVNRVKAHMVALEYTDAMKALNDAEYIQRKMKAQLLKVPS